MSTLHVVRHGQASFFAAHYDELSELGRAQSQCLGDYWAARGVIFDQVFTGPCRRQIDTAALVGEAFRAHQLPWPEAVELPGLDEYQAEAVLKLALPGLIEKHPQIRKLQAAVEASADRAETLRNFQRMYEVVISRWAQGEFDLPDVESFDAFCRRTHAAYETIAASGGSGRRVAAFTSGGPVGVALQRALQISPEHTLRSAWMVRNGAVSEFLFSDDRFTLSSFNAWPHLDEPHLLTYR